MATMVYVYGLLQPTQNGELAREQIYLAHKYYNTLIAIERDRRARVREIQARSVDVIAAETELATALVALATARTAIKAGKGLGKGSDPKLKSFARDLLEYVRTVRERLRAAKKASREDETRKVEIEAVDEAANAAIRLARGQCDVFWGSYLLVEQAVSSAVKAKIDPAFARWNAEGTLGVQLQNGLAAASVFGTDSRFQINPVDPLAWTSPTRGVRRRSARTHVRVRVGSEGRQPIWAEWPMIMHRNLPEGAVIKWVKVIMRAYADRVRWQLHVTVDVPDPAPNAGVSHVAVDIGWRKIEREIRVAVGVGSDGATCECRLPPSIAERMDKADSIRAIRDKNLDEIRAAVVAALPALPIDTDLREAVQTIASWRSPRRFVRLLRIWGEHRCENDLAVVTALNAWHVRDVHLWRYETGMRRHALLHRREIYRIFACRLAKQYAGLILERFDLRRVTEHPRPEEDAAAIAAEPARQRFVAAVSTLRLILRHAFEKRGSRVVFVDPAYTTQRCTVCGCETRWNAAIAIEHTCASCGVRFDQDENAGRNMIASAAMTALTAAALADKIDKTKAKLPRWHKRHTRATADG